MISIYRIYLCFHLFVKSILNRCSTNGKNIILFVKKVEYYKRNYCPTLANTVLSQIYLSSSVMDNIEPQISLSLLTCNYLANVQLWGGSRSHRQNFISQFEAVISLRSYLRHCSAADCSSASPVVSLKCLRWKCDPRFWWAFRFLYWHRLLEIIDTKSQLHQTLVWRRYVGQLRIHYYRSGIGLYYFPWGGHIPKHFSRKGFCAPQWWFILHCRKIY